MGTDIGGHMGYGYTCGCTYELWVYIWVLMWVMGIQYSLTDDRLCHFRFSVMFFCIAIRCRFIHSV
jgi:hypothetical protein